MKKNDERIYKIFVGIVLILFLGMTFNILSIITSMSRNESACKVLQNAKIQTITEKEQFNLEKCYAVTVNGGKVLAENVHFNNILSLKTLNNSKNIIITKMR